MFFLSSLILCEQRIAYRSLQYESEFSQYEHSGEVISFMLVLHCGASFQTTESQFNLKHDITCAKVYLGKFLTKFRVSLNAVELFIQTTFKLSNEMPLSNNRNCQFTMEFISHLGNKALRLVRNIRYCSLCVQTTAACVDAYEITLSNFLYNDCVLAYLISFNIRLRKVHFFNGL